MVGEGTVARTASIVNLTVHGIGAPARELTAEERVFWVDTARFEQVLDAAVARRDVRLSFDDGNSSDVEIALPRLRERGLVAEFFLLAGVLGQPGRIDRDGVRELSRAGMSIGLHGWAHRDWRRLTDQQMIEEFVTAVQVLTELSGRPVTSMALPYGSYDRHLLRRLRGIGASRVYTCDGGRTRDGAWLQSRTSVRHDLTSQWLRQVVDDSFPPWRRGRRAAVCFVKRARG